jgi:hypothetical protein
MHPHRQVPATYTYHYPVYVAIPNKMYIHATNRKHCITDYFLYYVIDCINGVCMCVLFSSPQYFPLV